MNQQAIVKEKEKSNQPLQHLLVLNHSKLNKNIKNDSIFVMKNNKSKSEEIKQANNIPKATIPITTLTTITKPIILYNSLIVVGRGEKPAPGIPVPKPPCQSKSPAPPKSPCTRNPP